MPRILKGETCAIYFESKLRMPAKYRADFVKHLQKKYKYFTDFAVEAVGQKIEREKRNMKYTGKRKRGVA